MNWRTRPKRFDRMNLSKLRLLLLHLIKTPPLLYSHSPRRNAKPFFLSRLWFLYPHLSRINIQSSLLLLLLLLLLLPECSHYFSSSLLSLSSYPSRTKPSARPIRLCFCVSHLRVPFRTTISRTRNALSMPRVTTAYRSMRSNSSLSIVFFPSSSFFSSTLPNRFAKTKLPRKRRRCVTRCSSSSSSPRGGALRARWFYYYYHCFCSCSCYLYRYYRAPPLSLLLRRRSTPVRTLCNTPLRSVFGWDFGLFSSPTRRRSTTTPPKECTKTKPIC